MTTPELRQMRYFVAVAQRRSFTRAAADVHVAQQALSQQVKALEKTLGVQLLRRTSRHVELTRAGEAFLADGKRILAATDRAVRSAQSAARGESGTLRVAYTLTTAYDTVPRLVAAMGDAYPEVKMDAREVFGGSLERLIHDEDFAVGLGPSAAYPPTIRQEVVRREPLRIALSERHRLAGATAIDLSALRDERFEVWPRDMAPGFYDAVIGACRSAGFEPRVDGNAAGATVWGAIAKNRGVALVVTSLVEQLPRGVTLVDVAPPRPQLTITAVVRADNDDPLVANLLATARELHDSNAWPSAGVDERDQAPGALA